MMLPPFGWRVDPKRKQRLMVYEPEATIIRQIFQLASQGSSPEKIAELFEAAGIPYPGERLDKDYMERFFRYKNWEHPEIEPIVDPTLFQEAQEKLEKLPLPGDDDEEYVDGPGDLALGALVSALEEAVEIKGEIEPGGFGTEFDSYFGAEFYVEQADEDRIGDYAFYAIVEAYGGVLADRRKSLQFHSLDMELIRETFDQCYEAMFHYDCDGMPRFFFGGTLNGVDVLLLFYPWSREDVLCRPKPDA